MTNHHRQSDDVLISLAGKVGTLAGVQAEMRDMMREYSREHKENKEELLEIKERLRDVPHVVHHKHHDFLAELIDEKKARKEACESFKRAIINRAAPIAMLAGLLFALYLLGAKETATHLLRLLK